MTQSFESDIMIVLISFWIILACTTYVMRDYLQGQELTKTPLSCFYLNRECPTLPGNQDNTIKNWFQNVMNDVFSTLNDIPVLNLFVPIGRLMFFQYSDQIHPLLTIFLDGTFIYLIMAIVVILKR